MGAATPLPPVLPLPLGAAMPAVGNRTEFIRGKIEDGRALPFRNQDSAALALLAEAAILVRRDARSEEHTSELQSLMRTSYAVFCLKKKNQYQTHHSEINDYHTHNKPN